MKKTDIMKNMGRTFHTLGFKMKKHSPVIFVAAGITGTVVSAVMACRATTKISTILDESKERAEKIHEVTGNEEMAEKYSQEDAQKDLTIVYVKTGLKLAKLYAPAVILGILSITSIVMSHRVLSKRNAAIAAAFAALDKDFKGYRGRVVERFGKAVDRELRYNIVAKEFEETVVDENGKEKTVKKTVEVANGDTYSEYARFFDESCEAWEKDSEYNLMFLRAQQQYANDLLRAKGYVFLNDVYDMLGIQRTKAGQIVGWVYNPDNPTGDNYIDFDIYDANREKARDFVNGYERVILLDFNVDGNILDLI